MVLTSETDIPAFLHLRSIKSHIKHLHASDSTAETGRRTRSASHNSGIVGGKPQPSSDVSLCNGGRLTPEGSQPCFTVVTCSNVVPPPWTYTSSSQNERPTARTPGELHVQNVPSDNPQAYTGTLWLIVEYRPAPYRVDPSQKGDGVPGVDAAVVGEIDVTTALPSEVEGTTGKPVRSRSQTYLAWTTRFVFSWTNVTSLCPTVEWV